MRYGASMTEIQFYHLLTTPLERALPKLMEKAYAAGMRALVHGSEAQCALLDRALWTYHPNAFLPHGTKHDPQPERQPIYLSSGEENPNGATLLVIVSGDTYDGTGPFTRVLDIFDGTDETKLAEARARWKHYRSQGFVLAYNRQKDDGGWETRAEAA